MSDHHLRPAVGFSQYPAADTPPDLRPATGLGKDPAPATPPAGPRRRWSWKLQLVFVLPVVLVGILVGGALLSSGEGDEPAEAALPTYSEAPRPLSPLEKRAKEEADAKSAIESALDEQAAALLSGDRKQFLAVVDPYGKSARTKAATPWLAERFDSLRALRVARWTAEPMDLSTAGGGDWSGDVRVDYCLVDPHCVPATAYLRMDWQLAPDGARLQAVETTTLAGAAPPWAMSKVKAVVGTRVVIASTPANARHLSALLPKAEAAARVADRYAFAGKPGRYAVYVAGKKEWARWRGGVVPAWVAGYAEQATETVVIPTVQLGRPGLAALLRHEMAHVATLSGRVAEVSEENWWLTEGMAEYVSEQGRSFSSYSDRTATVRFVRGAWRGDLRVSKPAEKASVADAAGRYGVAYLGMRCLVDKYGKKDAMTFFSRVALDGQSLSQAALSALGVEWSAVSKTCSVYVRRTAR